MDLVGEVFGVIGKVISNFTGSITSAIESITNIFYNTETGFSFVGIMLLIAVGSGIVYWAFKFIRRLVQGVL